MNITILLSALNFIKRNWKVALGLTAILVIALYWWGRTNTIKELTAENLNLKSNMQIVKMHYESELLNLQHVIDEQNKAVLEYERLNKEQKEQLDKAIKERKVVADKHKKEIQQIMHEAKPQNCTDAIQYLIDGVKDLL